MEAQQILQRVGESSTVEGETERALLVDEKVMIEAPPLIKNFEDMRFPEPILKTLKEIGIVQPTPIQAQGLPIILSGRDMIGLSPPGSGKTLVFVLPLIMLALQEEIAMPITSGQGPFGLVICPSIELASQIYDIVEDLLKTMVGESGYPELRPLLCIDGVDMRLQLEALYKGVHIAIATPGRLKDLLAKKYMNLDNCRYVTLDEADALVNKVFEEDIGQVFAYFKAQRQTLLFSATMSTKIHNFARRALVMPLTVTVTQGKHLFKILKHLEKTTPPVLIFCGNKFDVNAIHEYLVMSGVDAVAIHEGKYQEEIEYALSSFSASNKDVLVVTVAISKGLDLPDVRHVLNCDMPPEIEYCLHGIGTRGRLMMTPGIGRT